MATALKKAYWGLRQRLGDAVYGQAIRTLRREFEQTRSELLLSEKTSVASKVGQVRLAQDWRHSARRGELLPSLADAEFRAFSQNGEDGILLYLFALIGASSKACVEVCAGDGIECNSANLILNHGWTGLLVDGNEDNVRVGRGFYTSHRDAFSFPPRFVHAWVDRESINELIRSHGFEGEVDLLSIDLDGVDYWIWEAIEVIKPRVVVAEVQCIWGADRSVSVPYRPDFRSPLINGFGVYCGASLPAFVGLGRRKGYRLVGTQALGFNAFFVRNDVGAEFFPEVTAESCLNRPFVRWARSELLPLVKDREWIEV